MWNHNDRLFTREDVEQSRPLRIRQTFSVGAPSTINELEEWRGAVVHMGRRIAIEEHIDHPHKGLRRGNGAYDNGGYKCNFGY